MTTSSTQQATTAIDAITLEVDDVEAATRFYADAFDLGDQLQLRGTDAPTEGFRGFTLSLVTSQPANVDAIAEAALRAGATVIKPVSKSFWGYGGTLQAPDGTIWTLATSSKKNTGPASTQVDERVLLIGTEDMAATKRFYVDQGFEVAKSFGRKYTEFAAGSRQWKLALNGRRSLAKNAGVAPEGSGSHRIAVGSTAGTFTDPDGFAWESTK